MPANSKKAVNPAQFKPGQSGNPNGRPKMPEELKTKLRQGASKAVEYWLELAEDAKAKPEHRLKAAEALVSYAWGKPIQQVDADINAQAEVKTMTLTMAEKLKLVQEAYEAAKATKNE